MSAQLATRNGPRAWEASQKAKSAKAVAAGGRPLLRMATSPVPHVSWGRPVDIVRAHDGKLFRSVHEGGVRRETATGLLAGANESRVVVFVDQEAVALASDLLLRDNQAQAAQALPYLVRQGYAARYVCLTTALATRWWAPFDGRGSLSQWGKALGVTSGDDYTMARRLYNLLASGLSVPEQLDSTADRLVRTAVLPSLPNQFKAYDLAGALSEHWGAVSRRDPHLAEKYILAGEVVQCKPLRFGGGLILGQVSTPCKLRTGGKVLVYGPQGLEAQVDLVRFVGHDDQGNEGFFAELRVGKWGKTAEILLRSWQAGATWHLTAAPMTPRTSAQRAMWLVGKKSLPGDGERPEREVPVDVVLAGS